MGDQGLCGFSYVDTLVGVPFPDEAAMTIPKVSTFPIWHSGNTGTAVIDDLASGLGVRMTGYMPAGSVNSLTYAAVPVVVGSEGWQVTARMRRHIGLVSRGTCGIIMRDAVSGKSVVHEFGHATIYGFHCARYLDDDSFVLGTQQGFFEWHSLNWWIRVKDDLTSWLCYISADGTFWQQVYDQARNTYLGTTPTHVGIYMNPNYGAGAGPSVITGTPVATDCFSFLYEML